MEYAEFSFVKKININKYDPSIGKEIAQWLTALMSTSGGLVVLYSNRAESDKKRDQWLKNLKDHVTAHWIPNSTYRSMIQYKYMKKEGQLRIYTFVRKSKDLLTFEYNAYGRHATGIEPVTNREDLRAMLEDRYGTTDTVCTSQMQKLLGTRDSFDHNEEIPTEYCESHTIEFKHYWVDEKRTKDIYFVASKLKKNLERDDELLKNISAFANTFGGSLILGVKEIGKNPVVAGFETKDDWGKEEQGLTSYIEESLCSCIWSGHSNSPPVRGIEWDVFYHDVCQENGRRGKVIEIRVLKHSGVVFLRAPTCCEVTDSGCHILPVQFEHWKQQFFPQTNSKRKDDKRSQLYAHMKDSAKSKKRLSDSNQQSSSRSPFRPTADDSPELQDDESLGVKLHNSFEGEKIEIETYELNLLDCCTDKMANYLDEHQGLHQGLKVWYPSAEAIERKTSDRIQYGHLVEYINGKDCHGIATLISTENEFENESSGSDTNVCLLCYVLIISTKAHPRLIYCFGAEGLAETDESKAHVNTALRHARMLKKKFLAVGVNRTHQSVPFHFEVQVVATSVTGSTTELWDSEGDNIQPVPYPFVEILEEFDIACNGLAEELLKTECLAKDRVLIEHLTEEQARLLLKRKERILVVTGRSGTGKTIIALHLVHHAKSKGYRDDEILYICSSDGLKEFVRFHAKCTVWVMKATNSLSQQQRDWLVKTAKIIIVDDVHAISLSEDWKQNPEDLYCLLFTHAAQDQDSEVGIFFDPDQDYQSCLPENFDTELRNLAEHIVEQSHGCMSTQDILRYTLRENIRNSRKINRFMRANQSQAAKVEGTPVCLNEREGDGVTYDFIGSSPAENVSFLDAKLRGLVQRYGNKSIVILGDDEPQMEYLQKELTEKFKWIVENGDVYPPKGIVMSKLDDFGGRDSDVVLFLLPTTFGKSNRGNWQYINCVSSRAKLKLEFLLSWSPKDPVSLQKVKEFLALFHTPPIQYTELKMTCRGRIQSGHTLDGLCHSEGFLFTGERQKKTTDSYMFSLAVYQVKSNSGDITLLDRLDLWEGKLWSVRPRVELHSRRVFIPNPGTNKGVTVVHLENGRLVKHRPLTCARSACCVDVMSPRTLYACDSRKAYAVDIADDKITLELEKPGEKCGRLDSLAVLGKSVIVCYRNMRKDIAAVYRDGSSNPIKIILREHGEEPHAHPGELHPVYTASTDRHRHFIVTDDATDYVFVIDISGKLLHTVNIDTESTEQTIKRVDCAVVNQQLWLGYNNGDIGIMSSQ